MRNKNPNQVDNLLLKQFVLPDSRTVLFRRVAMLAAGPRRVYQTVLTGVV